MAAAKAQKRPASAVPARRKTAESKPVAPKAPAFSDFEPVSQFALTLNLVQDAVYARIRHRALLECLARGNLNPKHYLIKFRELVARDYRALYARLVLSHDDFLKLHGAWAEEDERHYREFFGFTVETIEHGS